MKTFHDLANQTNEYAHHKIASKQNGNPLLREINETEMKAFFGLLILKGIHSLPRGEIYWSTYDRLGVPGINNVMSQKRYKKLFEYLHVVDNTNEPDPADIDRDRLFKVRPLITMANETFLANYKPKQAISIDEAMVPFKGRSILRRYMPVKPVK